MSREDRSSFDLILEAGKKFNLRISSIASILLIELIAVEIYRTRPVDPKMGGNQIP